MLGRAIFVTGIAVAAFVAADVLVPATNAGLWSSGAHAAAPRARPAFKRAAAPKPRLKSQFRAKASQRVAPHKRLTSTPKFRLGQKNQLRQVFRAHAKNQPSYRIPARIDPKRITLGRYHPQKVGNRTYPSYVHSARWSGTRHFQIPTRIASKMTSARFWRENRKFLDHAIRNNHGIRLSSPGHAAPPGSGYARELAYLRTKGYKLSKDGMKMEAPRTSRSQAVGFNQAAARLPRLNAEFRKALNKQ